jgi:transposase InsO family protein
VAEDLVADGWRVSKKAVAASMAREGLVGRSPKLKRRLLTRPDKAAAPVRDLVRQDFSAETPDQRWCGDLTEIPTDEGKLYLATMFNRRRGRWWALLWVSITTPRWRRRRCARPPRCAAATSMG